MKVALFDAKPYDLPGFRTFGEKAGIEFKYYETRLTEDTVSLADGSDAVCVFVNDTVNAAVIDRLAEYGVRAVALRCAGYNNVDLEHAYGKVHVMHVPAYSPRTVAEHAAALLLTSVRRIHKAYNRTKDFNFSLDGLTGFELYGKKVGVVGTGRIGRAFAEICRGFGMKVLAYDRFPAKDADWIEYVELDELFAGADIISLHCPLTEETRHLVNRETVGKMKKGVILINTSRGGLIESDALLDGIKERKIGAACLDVYEEESDVFFRDLSGHIMDDDTLARLTTMPNVLLTAHQAFLTEEALSSIAEQTVNNLTGFFASGTSENELCYRCGKIEECRKARAGKCF